MTQDEQKKVDLILMSKSIKNTLKEVFNARKLKASDVVKDAKEKGMSTITKEKLSRYLNNDLPVRGFPTQRDILWLCTRYNVKVKLSVSMFERSEEQAIEAANKIMESTK